MGRSNIVEKKYLKKREVLKRNNFRAKANFMRMRSVRTEYQDDIRARTSYLYMYMYTTDGTTTEQQEN